MFYEILKDIKVYSFTNQTSESGPIYVKYLNRKLNKGSNYRYNSDTGKYELRDDEITKLLKETNVDIENINFNDLHTLKIDLSDNFNQCTNEFNKKIQQVRIIKILKITFLVIFWPIGLFFLLKNLQKNKENYEQN